MVRHKLEIKPLIVLDGAISHLTSYPCKGTSPSEVVSKLHEWMDTFQVNLMAICAVMAFRHLHDLQAFYRMHNIKRFPIGPRIPWPHRADMGVRLFKKFLSARVDTASKNLDQDYSVTDHTCPIDAQGSDSEKHTGNPEWQNADGVSHVKETKRSNGPSFHEIQNS